MKTCVIVMAHNDLAFYRHRKFWDLPDREPVIISPEDSSTGVPGEIKIGRSAHHGLEAHRRSLKALEVALESGADRVLIHEYDSICLSRELPGFKSGLFGNVFRNEDNDFLAPYYVNPPWLVDRDSLIAMKSAVIRYDLYEGGFQDRFIAAAAYIAGVPIRHHDPKGHSAATLTGHHDLFKLVECIVKGGTMIHGIKTQATLETIEFIYKNRKSLADIITA